jgi:hypothetical protein
MRRNGPSPGRVRGHHGRDPEGSAKDSPAVASVREPTWASLDTLADAVLAARPKRRLEWRVSKYPPLKKGQRAGQMTVIAPSGRRTHEYIMRCDCGMKTLTTLYELRSGTTVTCGCGKLRLRSRVPHPPIGAIYGRLTVVAHHAAPDHPYVLVKCSCNNKKFEIRPSKLRHSTASCGCLQTEARRRNLKIWQTGARPL